MLLAAAPAGADVLTVTSTADSGPGSLRATITAANSTPAADTIRFADDVRGAIVLGGTQLTITGQLGIEGPGARALAVSGNHLSRVFLVEAGATVAISGLTVANGAVFRGTPAVTTSTGGTGGTGGPGSGGTAGAEGATGGAATGTGSPGAAQLGGGIDNRGALTLTEVAVVGNQATAGDGGRASATGGLGAQGGTGGAGPAGGDGGRGGKGGNATATGGTGGSARGGGIHNGGTLTLERSTVSFNRAVAGDGGTATATGGNGGPGGTGGNNAGAGAGGRGGDGGTASATGGAAGDAHGAGVYNAGTLTVRASTIAANVGVPGNPGASAGTSAGSGGSGGSAGTGGSGGNGGNGATASAAVGARGTDRGGGVVGAEATQAALAGVTVAGNDASVAANVDNRGALSLQSSIVAEPRGGGRNCEGTVASLGHNIESAATCGLGQQGDRTDTDPGLGPLRDNGGPTDTRAIGPASPAVDQGASAGNATDQRGVPRPSDDPAVPNAAGGDGADVGAFEIPFVPDTTRPVISSAKASPKTAKRTTTLVYTLSEAASVAHTVDLALPGRTVGGKCRAPTRSNRNAKRCTRHRRIGQFTTQRTAGQNKQKLPSKVGGRKLGAGTYRATLVATDAALNRSASKTIRFRLTAR
jgi:hypothetical protein